MPEPGRQRAILGAASPLVGQGVHLISAGVVHRLEGEYQARFGHHAGARHAVMQHLRRIVKYLANATATISAHGGIPLPARQRRPAAQRYRWQPGIIHDRPGVSAMASCCENKSCEVTALRQSHSRILWAVLVMNGAMFIIEGYAGWHAGSTSLMADALDMLGDALVYAFSLFVLAKSDRWQASAALVKGGLMLAFGAGVLADAAYKIVHPAMPGVATMGAVGTLALLANLACFYLLYRHRADNLNLRSTWLCSRNDLIANLGVLMAAGSSCLLVSGWPDMLVGLVIAGLFLASACSVLRASISALRARPAPTALVKAPVTIEIRRTRSTGADGA